MTLYQPDEDSYLMQEVLDKKIPTLLKKNPNLKVLEIGAGSGINLQTLKSIGVKRKNVFSSDINPEAVAHCRKIGFNCIQSNLFENIVGKFDIILFNPPYLPEDKNEPADSQIATTGGKHGSEIINKFFEQAKQHLASEGKIYLLTSSLTKKINWINWKKRKTASEKLFFEELQVWELSI